VPFPNPATQLKGSLPGSTRPPIGKRRAKKLNLQAMIYATAFPEFEAAYKGTNVQWLLDVRAGKIKPDSAQIAAAVVLQRYGDDADPKTSVRDGVNLDVLSDDQRAMLALLLTKVLFGYKGPAPQIEAAPQPAPLLTEREHLLAELAKHESPEEIARLRNEWPKE
jgi:hypothetical protein